MHCVQCSFVGIYVHTYIHMYVPIIESLIFLAFGRPLLFQS